MNIKHRYGVVQGFIEVQLYFKLVYIMFFFFFSSRRRHTRLTCDWSSDVCSSDLGPLRLLVFGGSQRAPWLPPNTRSLSGPPSTGGSYGAPSSVTTSGRSGLPV